VLVDLSSPLFKALAPTSELFVDPEIRWRGTLLHWSHGNGNNLAAAVSRESRAY
jgi:hypothetical protein